MAKPGENQTIFQVNEENANRYSAFCLVLAAGIALLMNVVMPLVFCYSLCPPC